MKLTSSWIDLSFVSESGTGNGVATDFDLTYTPSSVNSVFVYLDGLLLLLTTHYTVDIGNKKISFVSAPAAAQKINVRYTVA